MSKPSTWLLDHKRDVYSQAGEDGILEKILEILPANDKWCVEFGAWDGLYLTNTRYLIKDHGFSAVLIEGNGQKFDALKQNYAQVENVIPVHAMVGADAEDNLDKILRETAIPEDFDLLSIDIDGNDYHVWKAVSAYQPKCVIIEFNPTVPTELEFVQELDPSLSQGASLLSMVELGKEKGYELVSVMPFNAIFVRAEFYPLFEIESNEPAVLRTNTSRVTYLFSGYDGKIFLRGNCTLPWHGIPLREKNFQQLPGFLRRYPHDYSFIQKCFFAVSLGIRNPSKFVEVLRRELAEPEEGGCPRNRGGLLK